LAQSFSGFGIILYHCGRGLTITTSFWESISTMVSVMAKQVKIPETHDSKTDTEADYADAETQVNLWSVAEDYIEALPEADQSDESESDSESPLMNDSSANCKGCWKFIFLWKVLSFSGLLACFLSTTEESVDIASMFDLDVECCAGQAAGSTALCIKANVCLPCESVMSDTVPKESICNSSNFAVGMTPYVGQVAGVVQMPSKSFSRTPGICKLVASLTCDSELHNNQMWKNVSQGKAISLDPEALINSVPHTLRQHVQEKSTKSSIAQWCPFWPSMVGVSSALLAISIKVMF